MPDVVKIEDALREFDEISKNSSFERNVIRKQVQIILDLLREEFDVDLAYIVQMNAGNDGFGFTHMSRSESLKVEFHDEMPMDKTEYQHVLDMYDSDGLCEGYLDSMGIDIQHAVLHYVTKRGREIDGSVGIADYRRPERKWTNEERYIIKKFGQMMHVYVIADRYEMLLEDKKKQVENEKANAALLEEARAKAEVASEAKTTFLFNMSHDIRTPMNAMKGYTDMAKRHIDDKAKVLDCLSKIEIAENHLLKLINEVLDMSRIEAGKVTLGRDPVDLLERFNDIMTIATAEANSKAISLEGKILNISDRFVFTDEARMNQIILNVIGNAIKYTDKDGKVIFTIEQLGKSDRFGTYRFVVEDTGIGMSAEYLNHVFEEFSREQNTTHSKIEGTGLGMSMVKEFVDMMDGTINIQSEKNKGTRVIFTLPFKRCSEDVIRKLSLPEVNDQISLKGKRILVVEDLELNREIAVEMLQDEGIIADSAENGQIAYEKVKNSKPGTYDLIFMDVQMPVMDGYESTRAIRAIPDSRLSRIPIVAMTANAFEEDRQEAIAAGMDEHLAKPVTPEKIREIIRRYVR